MTETEADTRPFEFDGEWDGSLSLPAAVFQSLGAASVCWENPGGAGVFDSTRAHEIGDRLLQFIEAGVATNAHARRDMLETAWGIIANAGGGHWETQTEEWRGAAERWRDEYQASLATATPRRMRKVYLASRYSRHDEMQGVSDVLRGLGVEVTSRWIWCHTDVVGDFTSSFTPEFINATPELAAPLGKHDLDDLDLADTVISFTSGDGGKGGRHVEFGYGLAKGLRCIVVGPREHVFHTLPQVEWYPNWSRLVMALASELKP